MSKGPEARLQNQVLYWLRFNRFLAFAIPNRGFFKPGKAGYGYCIVDKYHVPGIPDIEVVLGGGVTVRIELKSAKGVVSDAQREFHERLMLLGHPVFVARRLEDVQSEFANRGYKP